MAAIITFSNQVFSKTGGNYETNIQTAAVVPVLKFLHGICFYLLPLFVG